MKIKSFLVIISFSVFGMASCGKIESVPPQPRISYTDFSVFDTIDPLGNTGKGGRLKFKFQDGDGDLGLPDTPVAGEDSVNLFFTMYRIRDGVEIIAPPDDPLYPSSYRIPYIDRSGRNKILKGTISVTFFYLFYTDADSVKYDFFVKDRAGNISNSDSTGVISIFSNGVYK
ncbi:MAG: hypothetical protein WCE64_11225 [Bacteroidales bacterium]